MTLSTVAAAYDSAPSPSASWTFTTASTLGHTPAVGNCVVIYVISFNSAASEPTGHWTPDGQINTGGAGTSSGRLTAFSRVFDGTENSTYTFTMGTNAPGVLVVEMNDSANGLWRFGGLFGVLTAQATATPSWGASGTLPSATGIAIGGGHTAVTNVALNSVANGGTWTVRSGAADNGQAATTITSSTASVTPTATLASSQSTKIAGWAFYYTILPARPSAVAMSVSVKAPTISTLVPVTPTAASMDVSVKTPTIHFDNRAAPSPQASALAVALPSITGTADVPSGAAALALAVGVPTLTVTTNVPAPTVPLTFVLPAPSPLIGTVVTAPAVAMVLARPAPSFVASSTLTATAVAMGLSPLSVSAQGVSRAFPGSFGAILAIRAPTLFATTDGVVAVNGQFLRDDGTPCVGLLRFTMPTSVLNTLTNVQYGPASIEVTLDATGSFTVALPATNALGTEPDRFWVITEWVDGQAREYAVLLPASPPIVDISDLTPLL